MNPTLPLISTITTKLNWEDLVLKTETLAELEEIINWQKKKDALDDKEKARGYAVLFYGAPGTGKTLSASLIGKALDKAVIKVDLHILVSKYIGETEKNLAKIFDAATASEAILFFDEADALFGKRTEIKDAHDRYANQEVSYLLQRMESFAGLCIFASNLKSNLDEGFVRRFNAIIKFPSPDSRQRLKVWKNLFASVALSKEIDIQDVAEKYELTPGRITNAVRLATTKMQAAKKNELTNLILIEAIRKEIEK